MKQYTFSELNQMRITKGELFQPLKQEGAEFDYALPLDWLNSLADYCKERFPLVTYGLIRSTTVWLYTIKGFTFGDCFTACKEVQEAIDTFNTESNLSDLMKIIKGE